MCSFKTCPGFEYLNNIGLLVITIQNIPGIASRVGISRVKSNKS